MNKEELHKLIDTMTWGELTILFKNGKLTSVKKTETFQPKESEGNNDADNNIK